ncbi:lysis protein [Salmonella enterica subsp. enterica]|uniref:Lysis protein n=1 Tax=Salmonella enterica TaxID=28901 RepID=A0A633DFH5_SALER|nr:lysis protein [Salmonella enterica]EBW2603398.1 lysis protein [Salmonella enterica subsp. enterica serovar Poano]MIY13469.1 lysis protein [Salmonella enterica subsp. enterica serovar Jangwani]EBE9327440.1 lysis protein [Salmonella enterica]ECC0574636.1 lysis protein [Salmonella enterica]
MNRITTGVIISLLIVAAALAWATDRYYGNAVKYKGQRDTATHNLKLANETITDMTKRQRDVAALDARYTKELANAKAENDALRDDVAAGRRRLYVNATCPAAVRKATAAPGVDHAASATLTANAERDYWRLRDGIATVTKQIEGAQDYIRTQCR